MVFCFKMVEFSKDWKILSSYQCVHYFNNGISDCIWIVPETMVIEYEY